MAAPGVGGGVEAERGPEGHRGQRGVEGLDWAAERRARHHQPVDRRAARVLAPCVPDGGHVAHDVKVEGDDQGDVVLLNVAIKCVTIAW